MPSTARQYSFMSSALIEYRSRVSERGYRNAWSRWCKMRKRPCNNAEAERTTDPRSATPKGACVPCRLGDAPITDEQLVYCIEQLLEERRLCRDAGNRIALIQQKPHSEAQPSGFFAMSAYSLSREAGHVTTFSQPPST